MLFSEDDKSEFCKNIIKTHAILGKDIYDNLTSPIECPVASVVYDIPSNILFEYGIKGLDDGGIGVIILGMKSLSCWRMFFFKDRVVWGDRRQLLGRRCE